MQLGGGDADLGPQPQLTTVVETRITSYNVCYTKLLRNHTEAICTRDHGNAMRFLREADASLVAVNASTRFNDGGELGLGAEISYNFV